MPSCRPPRAFAAVLLTALCALLLPAPGAAAQERVVQGGRLDWSIKSSFQNYVTGPIAQGSWSMLGGAGTIGGGQFRFHSASGGYDPDTGTFRAAFSGGVRFLGHRKDNGTHELDLTISRPTVRINGNTGTLYADMASRPKGGGALSNRSQVPLARLALGGVDMRGGGSPIALAGVPATLTAEGAGAFAGYYPAGTPLDPVSLSVDVRAPARKPAAPTADPEKDARSEKEKGEQDTKERTVTRVAFKGAVVDWGVRRTFREYVTGPIADGSWKVAEGARDGGALYRFTGGKGHYDRKTGELTATLRGAVTFTGNDLDLSLTDLRVRIAADGKGTLLTDDRPLVTFTTDAKPSKGLLLVEETPTELTEEGAKFFGSMYRAGTAMDPLTLAVPLDDSADLPPLPDLGSEPTDTPEPSTSATPSGGPDGDPAVEPAASAEGFSASVPIALGGASVAAMAAAYWLLRRRRTTTSPTTPADSEE
ncbi:HtaA domain-containing protein [Streptomyces alkaliterrae]|uniref:HtaA domain-containing protein n=2 Tax=Streptomyces alkaliterrae TaxID=2213162 RepID=A0A7W3ZRI5_9ACTN|nr:HtaA domain-containing protein [Streptomyces alkaliterrae]MBB1257863.1 HtaA domain-containing protein [Streptomyces alkaliterrae]